MTKTAEEKKEFLKRQIDCITQYVKEDSEVDSEFYYEFMKGCEPTLADYEAVSEPLYQTLTVSKDAFDWQNDFKVRVGKPRPQKGTFAPTGEERIYDRSCIWNVSLHLCDGVYVGINACSCISSSYSNEQIRANQRMYKLRPVEHGDKVIINNEFYIAKVNGHYSNCIEFYKEEV
jgi:hypothetical protein